MRFSREHLVEQLNNLGINSGDTVLVRAGLGKIGRLASRDRMEFIEFLLEAVGPEGTIVGLSFTESSFITKNPNIVYDVKESKAITGSFANIMLSHEKAIRSTHPTNSYVAIGKNAQYILADHDETAGAYEPIRKLIELEAKMVLIGCVSESPGFTTTHLAEVDLGMHKKIIFPWLNTAYYRNNKGEVVLYKRWDLGGCSGTFYRFYSQYVKEEVLRQGYIGKAYSISINAKDAYDIDIRELKNNSKLNVCGNKECLLCRARRWDNLIDLPGFIVRKIVRRIKS